MIDAVCIFPGVDLFVRVLRSLDNPQQRCRLSLALKPAWAVLCLPSSLSKAQQVNERSSADTTRDFDCLPFVFPSSPRHDGGCLQKVKRASGNTGKEGREPSFRLKRVTTSIPLNLD